MAATREFTISTRTTGWTEPLKTGEVTIPGVKLNFVEIKPQIAAFRRMIRNQEFDICELASTTYMIARSIDKPFKAIPVWINRRFHHAGMLVHPDSGIKGPKDLEGKKVGCRAYTVTTSVWTRGVFQSEFGMDTDKVTWVVDDEEHVTEVNLPENVIHAPEGKSIAGMMAAGEIQAGLAGNAGIGRAGAPSENWNANAVPSTDNYVDLVPNAEELAADFYARTGVYPVHPTIALKDEVVEANPDLPKLLFDAFVEAKNIYLAKLRSGELDGKEEKKWKKLMKVVGDDPLPYGLEGTRKTIEMQLKYAEQQKLMAKKMTVDELYYNF